MNKRTNVKKAVRYGSVYLPSGRRFRGCSRNNETMQVIYVLVIFTCLIHSVLKACAESVIFCVSGEENS